MPVKPMPTRLCMIAGAGAVALTAIAGGANAKPLERSQAMIWCKSKDKASLNLQIRGCGSLIRTSKINEKLAVLFEARGLAHYRKGRYARAIADYDEAIRLGASNALYNRSLAKDKLGDTAGAAADYAAFRRAATNNTD